MCIWVEIEEVVRVDVNGYGGGEKNTHGYNDIFNADVMGKIGETVIGLR